jgi:adenylate cyclase
MLFEIDQPILEHGGEAYGYVGDEVIESWPLSQGIDDARSVACALAIQDTLARRADDYRWSLGSAPGVRVVLHAGPVVAGECGAAKLAIVHGKSSSPSARSDSPIRV